MENINQFQELEKELDLEFQFTDLTIIEGNCNYQKINNIMSKQLFGNKKWMLLSNLQILYQTKIGHSVPIQGCGFFQLQFFSDKKIIIQSFNSDQGLRGRDLEILNIFMKSNGWTTRSPNKYLVENKNIP